MYSCCVRAKNGFEMKTNQTKQERENINLTKKNATPQISEHQTHLSGFMVSVTWRRPVPVQREGLEGIGRT